MSTTVDTAFAPVTFSEGAAKELYKLKDQQEISEDYGSVSYTHLTLPTTPYV